MLERSSEERDLMMERQVKVMLKWGESASMTVLIYITYDCLYLDIFVTSANLISLIVM